MALEHDAHGRRPNALYGMRERERERAAAPSAAYASAPMVNSSLLAEPAFVTFTGPEPPLQGRMSFDEDPVRADPQRSEGSNDHSPPTEPTLERDEGEDDAADAGPVWVPLPAPKRANEPMVGKRFTPLGNTFLNLEAGEDEEPGLEDYRRHTFGEFGSHRAEQNAGNFHRQTSGSFHSDTTGQEFLRTMSSFHEDGPRPVNLGDYASNRAEFCKHRTLSSDYRPESPAFGMPATLFSSDYRTESFDVSESTTGPEFLAPLAAFHKEPDETSSLSRDPDMLLNDGCEREMFNDNLERSIDLQPGSSRSKTEQLSAAATRSSEVLAKWREDNAKSSSKSRKPLKTKGLPSVEEKQNLGYQSIAEEEEGPDVYVQDLPVFSTFDQFETQQTNQPNLRTFSSFDEGVEGMPARISYRFDHKDDDDDDGLLLERDLGEEPPDDDPMWNMQPTKSNPKYLFANDIDDVGRIAGGVPNAPQASGRPGPSHATAGQGHWNEPASTRRAGLGNDDVRMDADAVQGQRELAQMMFAGSGLPMPSPSPDHLRGGGVARQTQPGAGQDAQGWVHGGLGPPAQPPFQEKKPPRIINRQTQQTQKTQGYKPMPQQGDPAPHEQARPVPFVDDHEQAQRGQPPAMPQGYASFDQFDEDRHAGRPPHAGHAQDSRNWNHGASIPRGAQPQRVGRHDVPQASAAGPWDEEPLRHGGIEQLYHQNEHPAMPRQQYPGGPAPGQVPMARGAQNDGEEPIGGEFAAKCLANWVVSLGPIATDAAARAISALAQTQRNPEMAAQQAQQAHQGRMGHGVLRNPADMGQQGQQAAPQRMPSPQEGMRSMNPAWRQHAQGASEGRNAMWPPQQSSQPSEPLSPQYHQQQWTDDPREPPVGRPENRALRPGLRTNPEPMAPTMPPGSWDSGNMQQARGPGNQTGGGVDSRWCDNANAGPSATRLNISAFLPEPANEAPPRAAAQQPGKQRAHAAAGPSAGVPASGNGARGGGGQNNQAAGSGSAKANQMAARKNATQDSQGLRVSCFESKTLMVRNIPVRYTQDMLLKEWPNDTGMYDFLYLPICIDRKRNASFCFINFNSQESAIEFQQTWHKKRLANFSTRKPLDISPADVQGRDENLLQILRNKTFRIRNIHFQPAIFKGPERVTMEDFLEELDGRFKTVGTRAPALACSQAYEGFSSQEGTTDNQLQEPLK